MKNSKNTINQSPNSKTSQTEESNAQDLVKSEEKPSYMSLVGCLSKAQLNYTDGPADWTNEHKTLGLDNLSALGNTSSMAFQPEKITGLSEELKSLSKEDFATWFYYRREKDMTVGPAAWLLVTQHNLPLNRPSSAVAMKMEANTCKCDSRDLAFFGHARDCAYKKSLSR